MLEYTSLRNFNKHSGESQGPKDFLKIMKGFILKANLEGQGQ